MCVDKKKDGTGEGKIKRVRIMELKDCLAEIIDCVN